MTTQTAPERNNPTPDSLLRRSLGANGTFSAISGLLLAAGAGVLGPWLGVPVWLAAATGLGLLLFAAGVLRNAMRDRIDLDEARLTVGLDVLWVAASAAVLLAGLLGNHASIAVAIVADIVLVFAVLQALGLRRVARA